jgi:hypothetical protein
VNKIHDIRSLAFVGDELVIVVDGKTHHLKLADISSKLLQAATMERERYEISPSGYGIRWPLLDEDLSINGLLGIAQAPSFVFKKAA